MFGNQNGITYNVKKSTNTASSIGGYLQKISSESLGNQLFVGTSGCGKKYAAKLEIKKALATGKQVIILDPQKAFKEFAQKTTSTTITLGRRNNQRLNPLEINSLSTKREGFLDEKCIEVMRVIEAMIGRVLTSSNRIMLRNALKDMYKQHGIHDDGFEQNEKTIQMPTLSDFETELLKSEKGRRFLLELDPYINGFANELNSKRTFDIYESPMIVFDINDCERDTVDITLLAVLQFISNMIKDNVFGDTLLVIDQAWMILKNKRMADYLTTMIEELNQHQTNTLLITQLITDFENTEEELLELLSTKVFFRQTYKQIDTLKTQFGFGKQVCSFLETAPNREVFVQMKNGTQFFMTFEDKETFDTTITAKKIY